MILLKIRQMLFDGFFESRAIVELVNLFSEVNFSRERQIRFDESNGVAVENRSAAYIST